MSALELVAWSMAAGAVIGCLVGNRNAGKVMRKSDYVFCAFVIACAIGVYFMELVL